MPVADDVWRREGRPRMTRSFREAGFRVTEIIEPTVTPEQLQHYPQLDEELRVPNFIVYVLQKP